MVLVALLIIGVTAGIIASWAEHMGREQKSMELIATKGLLDQSLSNAAFDEIVCHKIIQRECTTCPAATAGASLPLTINLGSLGVMNTGLSSQQMGIQFPNISLENLSNVGGITWEGTLVLEVAALANTQAFGGNRFPPMRLPGFRVDLTPGTHQIERCIASSPEANCIQLGGQMDSTNYNPPRCVLPTNYTGLTCAGNETYVKDAAGNVSCVPVSDLLASGSCPSGKFLYSFGYGANACLTLSEIIGRVCGPNSILRSNGNGTGSCASLPQIVGEVCPLNHALASDGAGGARCVPFVANTPVVNCVGAWSACSTSCGDGVQTYNILTPASGGGAACTIAEGTQQACNLGACSGPTMPTTPSGPTTPTMTQAEYCASFASVCTPPGCSVVPMMSLAAAARCDPGAGGGYSEVGTRPTTDFPVCALEQIVVNPIAGIAQYTYHVFAIGDPLGSPTFGCSGQ